MTKSKITIQLELEAKDLIIHAEGRESIVLTLGETVTLFKSLSEIVEILKEKGEYKNEQGKLLYYK